MLIKTITGEQYDQLTYTYDRPITFGSGTWEREEDIMQDIYLKVVLTNLKRIAKNEPTNVNLYLVKEWSNGIDAIVGTCD